MEVKHMVTINENLQIPCEGIFWVIDDELISFTDQVDPKDPFNCTDLTHKETWKYIKDKYKVNEHTVGYDYFPRGRVETLVIQNNDGSLDHYEASIYLDKCIYDKDIIDNIINEFRLYLSNVLVNVEGQLFIDGSHYTCHMCR